MEQTNEKRGLHNWRNLFKKPTLAEWMVLIMLIMIFVIAWAYQRDIKACQTFYKENACEICNEQRLGREPNSFIDSNITIKEDLI